MRPDLDRADLWARAAGDVCPGRREHLRPRLQRCPRRRAKSPTARSSGAPNASSPPTISNSPTPLVSSLISPMPRRNAARLVDRGLALPAYDQCLKASHLFNLLDARGAVSVTERASLHPAGQGARQGVLRRRGSPGRSRERWRSIPSPPALILPLRGSPLSPLCGERAGVRGLCRRMHDRAADELLLELLSEEIPAGCSAARSNLTGLFARARRGQIPAAEHARVCDAAPAHSHCRGDSRGAAGPHPRSGAGLGSGRRHPRSRAFCARLGSPRSRNARSATPAGASSISRRSNGRAGRRPRCCRSSSGRRSSSCPGPNRCVSGLVAALGAAVDLGRMSVRRRSLPLALDRVPVGRTTAVTVSWRPARSASQARPR